MKQLIGSDIGSYTFDASEKTVTFAGVATLQLEQILLITNVTDGIIIYNFADAAAGGSIAANVLTLDYDTTSMSDTDDLQCFVDIDPRFTELEITSITRSEGYVIQVVYTNGINTMTVDITRDADEAVTDVTTAVS